MSITTYQYLISWTFIQNTRLSCSPRPAASIINSLCPRKDAEIQSYIDPESSQRVGQNGPLLLQDFHLIDLLAHFDRERIPERVVHAKGAGAYGEFEVTHDISDLVCMGQKRRRPRSMLTSTRLHWICSMTLERRLNASLVFLLWGERRVHLTRREILGASLSSFILRRVTGIGYSTTRLFSSYVIPQNFPFSSILRSGIHRPI